MSRNGRIYFALACEVVGLFFSILGILYQAQVSSDINSLPFFILAFLFLFAPLAEYIIESVINNKKAKEYEQWLLSHKFVKERVIGGVKEPGLSNMSGLVVNDKQTCFGTYLSRFILRISSIVGVEIQKNGIVVSNSTDLFTGKAKHHGGHSHLSGMNFGTAVSQDRSTYDVYIKTSNSKMPSVQVPCGRNYAAVQTICGLIDIWLGDNGVEGCEQSTHDTEGTPLVYNDVPEVLRKYKQLLDDGIINYEEFEEQKRRILKIGKDN